MSTPDLNAPGWVVIAGEWRWTGVGRHAVSQPFVPTGCDCDASEGRWDAGHYEGDNFDPHLFPPLDAAREDQS